MKFSSSRSPSASNNGYEAWIISNIKELGWSLTSVFDEKNPCFVYSIGLEHSFEHPELIVLGLPPDTGGALLNTIAELVKAGQHFRAGDVCKSEETRFNIDVMLGEVDPERQRKYLLSAEWFYHGNDFRTLQVLWPDTKGRFPDHPRFEKRFRADQPLLG